MPITYLDEKPQGKITYLDEQPQQPQPSVMQQLGQGFKGIAEGAINPPYRIASHTLQGLEGLFRKGKATTYKNPLTGDVVEPYTNQTPLTEPLGLGMQGAALPLGPVGGGAMYGGGMAMEQGGGVGDILKNAGIGAILGKAVGVASGEPILPPMIKNRLSKVGISKIRDYPANKVNSIRKSFWDKYAPEEYSAYGKAIDDLPGTTPNVKGDVVIQNLEKTLSDKNLMSADGTLLKGFSSADNKLITAYQKISRKWAESPNGELNINDIVGEYKNIKGKYTGKANPVQRQNIQAANDFFNSVADQINVKSFTKAKERYGIFKDNQQMIHEAINLYGPEMKTAKGEKFLTEGTMSKTTQGRKTSKMITEKTGQGLMGAKAWTKVRKVNPLTWIKR
jgi:hypothetical protein